MVPRGRRPRPHSDKWDYVTDDELGRLWQSFEKREDMLGPYLCKTAVATGMRLGDLSGLQRGDVDLVKRTVTVQRTFTDGVGVTTPKSGKGRTLNLTDDAIRVLRAWFEHQGVQDRDALVFPNEAGGHLDGARAQTEAVPGDGRRRQGGRQTEAQRRVGHPTDRRTR